MIAALLAVERCVPIVTNTCAGNWPSRASIANIFRAPGFRFLFAFTSLYTKGTMNKVASNIGLKEQLTVKLLWRIKNVLTAGFFV
jgi:hypothetical protein